MHNYKKLIRRAHRNAVIERVGEPEPLKKRFDTQAIEYDYLRKKPCRQCGEFTSGQFCSADCRGKWAAMHPKPKKDRRGEHPNVPVARVRKDRWVEGMAREFGKLPEGWFSSEAAAQAWGTNQPNTHKRLHRMLDRGWLERVKKARTFFYRKVDDGRNKDLGE